MKHVNKINALLDNLPESQRASLMARLKGSAPQLLVSTNNKGGKNKPIDTPMRRAKAIARQLTRGELPKDAEVTDESKPENPPPKINILLALSAQDLLKIYQASTLEEWLNALKIAEPEIKEYLLLHLPAREKSELEEALRQLGPVKLSQAQSATDTVMSKAQDLAQGGGLKSWPLL